uniref:Ubiquitin-like domain-containing protein n=1 Tax=Ananas comosus var. bracteatus TaxID=296719 RepID=A0A6V7QDW7_ANACO|nr:unnamed protein product [Ananas comosus var. bracteatus]
MPKLRSLGDRILYGVTRLEAHMLPRTNGDMEIFVRSNNGNYALEVDSSNTIWDVLIAVLGDIRSLGRWPKPTLWFNGSVLEEAKSLSDYGIHDRCVDEKKYIMILQPSVIWLKEYDKVLLDLMVVLHTRNGGNLQ